MRPAGVTLERATSLSGETPQPSRRDLFLSPRIVAREAVKVLAARGDEIRPAVVRVLVKRFIEEGHTTLAEIEPFVLGYLDPTGETAVRNVMRSRR